MKQSTQCGVELANEDMYKILNKIRDKELSKKLAQMKDAKHYVSAYLPIDTNLDRPSYQNIMKNNIATIVNNI
jgi:CO dehydrogenase nickel-insertion accessory protein CooC1